MLNYKISILMGLLFVSLTIGFVPFVRVIEAREEDAIRAAVTEMTQGQEFSSNRIRVVYKDDLEKFEAARTTESRKGLYKVVEVSEVTGKSEGNGAVANTSESVKNVEDALYELLSDPEVAYAAPDYLGHIAAWTDNGTQSYPGDYDVTGPTFNQWYYDAGKVKEMWDDQGCPAGPTCGGDSSVVVGVLDTGVAYDAFDDQTGDGFTENNFTAVMGDVPNLWTNSGEIAANGMDDDCNGVIDDVHGIDTFAFTELEITDVVGGDSLSERTCNSGTPVDFSGTSNTFRRKPGYPVDTYGHGTFVTGLIAGQVDNGGDTVSPAFNVSIMPLAASINTTNNTHTSQVYDSGDYSLFWMSDVQTAIEYAGVNGVDIINMSIGGFLYDQLSQDQIDYWHGEGVVFVAASGNDSTSGTMQGVSYPAAFDNVIAVGAVNADNTRSDYSNGGAELDLVAYVGEVNAAGTAAYQETLTCYGCTSAGPFNNTASDTSIGTSFAAPQVAAAAAIIKSNNPEYSPNDVRLKILFSTTDIGTAGVDNATGHGVLDFSALDDPDFYKQYFTWYDTRYSTRSAYVLVGNPSDSETATVNIKIGDGSLVNEDFTILPGGRITPEWRDIQNGPVVVTSDIDVYATQRVHWNDSFNEFAGITESSLSNSYYFTWYDTRYSTRSAYVLVGNPSSTTTANVNIKIGDGSLVDEDFTIPPGGRIAPEWRDIQDGPVVVTSDIDVYATQRVHWNSTFNEYAGIPANSLSDTYYFTWYDTRYSTRSAYVLVGNPSSTTTANVNIKIGDGSLVDEDFTIPPGGRITPEWRDIQNGPVVVTSDIDVYATQRVHWNDSFNEYAGIPANSLSDRYYFTWYDTRYSTRSAYVLVGNPSSTTTANVNIKIGDGSLVDEDFTIPPGGRITPEWRDIQNGPVVVTSDIDVYSTQRVHWNSSFNEYPGIIK